MRSNGEGPVTRRAVGLVERAMEEVLNVTAPARVSFEAGGPVSELLRYISELEVRAGVQEREPSR